MSIFRFLPATLVSVFIAACGEPAPVGISVGAELEQLANQGRVISETRCASCHAVGEKGVSPNSKAPVFRTLFSRYSSVTRDEEFITGLQAAHVFPELKANTQDVDALIMYLHYIQEKVD